MRITTSAGHSYACDGASGCGYSEHAEAVWCNNKFISLCKEYGVPVSDCTSEASTVSGYLNEQVRKANASGADIAIQWHFNATAGAVGAECLYVTERSLSVRVSAAISNASGLVDRGAKYRSDLYWLNQTAMPAILIEVCFIDTQSDMNKWEKYHNEIIEAVFTAVTGIEIKEEPVSVELQRPEADIYHANLTDAQRVKLVHIKDDTYKIQSAVRGLCLDAEGGYTTAGTNVRWAEDNGTEAQRWILHTYEVDGSNAYGFELAKNGCGMMLDVCNGGTVDGTGLQLYPSNKTASQAFYLLDAGDGYYYIMGAKSLKCLDVVNGGWS